ncbi:hypothetical protein EPI10_008361 [Gossypium australe]|uniref:Uncharacterized protein n=1 Tax=Gossypium australe TaxID=47621 RepID=A0A5B6V4T2_9ROSI|nr:hypothetical protein EPI10_008361 [Gossypium australe]
MALVSLQAKISCKSKTSLGIEKLSLDKGPILAKLTRGSLSSELETHYQSLFWYNPVVYIKYGMYKKRLILNYVL